MNRLEEFDVLQRLWNLEQTIKPPPTLEIKLDGSLYRPIRSHSTDAGLDLKCKGEHVIEAGANTLVKTGVSVKIPVGYVGLLVPRSSLSKLGITMSNSIGIIDSDYRGEIKASLTLSIFNGACSAIKLEDGERIVQLVIVPILLPQLKEVSEEGWLDTVRGTGGFGSTNK